MFIDNIAALVYKKHCEVLIAEAKKHLMMNKETSDKLDRVMVPWEKLSPGVQDVWIKTVEYTIDVVKGAIGP